LTNLRYLNAIIYTYINKQQSYSRAFLAMLMFCCYFLFKY
jgi:hypothetical protein